MIGRVRHCHGLRGLVALTLVGSSIALAADEEDAAPKARASAKPAAKASEKSVAGPITFNKHIAPILWKNCASCHRPGEIGPFSLLSYQDASKRAEFLAEVTGSHRMPPWKPEPNFGTFRDERRLPPRDIKLIADWAKAGAPEGDAKDLPQKPKFSEGWQLGKPDLVLKMSEAFTVPADGADIYRCFVIPIPGDKSRYVSGVEFRPGNARVVHHAIMFLDSNGEGRKREAEDDLPGFVSFGGPGITPTGGLGAWAPGATPQRLPAGLVKYVRSGSDVVLQIHYHPSGKEEIDQSQIGIYFAKANNTGEPIKVVTGIAVAQGDLKLAPGEKSCEVKAESEALPVDVRVLGVTPHMHNLGREFKVTAQKPDKSEEVPLIWIKDWDFNWQGQYQFAKPIRLPKGSKILISAVYDNSADNPKNPNHPPKEVHWGEQTSDEMCLCSVQVYTDKTSDLKQVAQMHGHELGAGIDGGTPAQAMAATKTKNQARRTSDKKPTSKVAAKGRAANSPQATEANADMPPAGNPTANAPAAADAPAVAAEAAPVAAETPRKGGKQGSGPLPNFPSEGVPIEGRFKAVFAQFDHDGDGRLSPEEFGKMNPAVQGSVLTYIRNNKSKSK